MGPASMGGPHGAMQWAGGSAHYLSCTVQDVLGPHRTARGRAPPVRRGSAPRLGRVGFGRVGPLSRRLRSERGEPFQAVPSAELSSAGHVGKFEPGFGLVAKPAPPLWTHPPQRRWRFRPSKEKWSETSLSVGNGHRQGSLKRATCSDRRNDGTTNQPAAWRCKTCAPTAKQPNRGDEGGSTAGMLPH